jgi:lyso-ornithine lipid O-acyltransferase
MSVWNPDDEMSEPTAPFGAGGWLRIALKAPVIAVGVFGGLLVLLVLRLPEYAVHGVRRPWTGQLVSVVSRFALRIIGLPLKVEGHIMSAHGGIVANHSSWLDIFTLSATGQFYFVAKSEVARWAFIGWLARATGTVFIRRDRKDTKRQMALFNARLSVGHRLLFFPEGTSTDGARVLPFKTTLFQPFLAQGHEQGLKMQPVTVIYTPPAGADARFYGWWGDMSFGPHLLKVLAARRQGAVTIVFHPPVAVDGVAGRKEVAAACEAAVRSRHPFGEG